MCNDCGCEDNKENKIENRDEIIIEKNVLDANDEIAHQNNHLLMHKKAFAINVMGSPGAGKTTVIERIAKVVGKEKVLVIQGDLESDIDTRRLEEQEIDAYQINTHSGCHLNAKMINSALMNSDISDKEYIIIENVGNLVCPANIKLGQEMDVVVSSTTEGSDKPKKYPAIFASAQAIIISKADLAEYVGFDEKMYMKDLIDINKNAKIFKTEQKDMEAFKNIGKFIEEKRKSWVERSEHHHHDHHHK